MILIDTHVAAWLYQGPSTQLTPAVRERLSREQIGLSPFSRLELQYLYERGRTREPADQVVANLARRLGVVTVDVSATAVCNAAAGLSWTRDPFDRLLAAHATAQGLILVTRDATMRQHLPLAWWA